MSDDESLSVVGKLLVFGNYWPTVENSISGIFVVQQVAAFARLGYQVTVLLPRTIGRNKSRPCSVDALGLNASMVELIAVDILRLPEKLSSLPGAIGLNVRLCGRRLAAEIRSLSAHRHFDGCVVHAPRYIGLSLPFWQQMVNGRALIVMHGEEPFLTCPRNARSAKPFFEVAANSARAFVLVGSRLKAYAHTLGIPEAKTQVVPNGTDLSDFATVSDRQRPVTGHRRILSVSNLVPLKGIDDNLRALAIVARSRPDLAWTYRIVGDGSYRAALETLARELQIADRVQFLGRLAYGDTMLEMSEADIFSLPSWNEAFGIVYLEAMMRMKPVIGCLENGAADIITDGEDGLLVPPRSVTHLAAAMARLIGNPEECQVMGRNARHTASSHTWEKNARRIVELLDL